MAREHLSGKWIRELLRYDLTSLSQSMEGILCTRICGNISFHLVLCITQTPVPMPFFFSLYSFTTVTFIYKQYLLIILIPPYSIASPATPRARPNTPLPAIARAFAAPVPAGADGFADCERNVAVAVRLFPPLGATVGLWFPVPITPLDCGAAVIVAKEESAEDAWMLEAPVCTAEVAGAEVEAGALLGP